MKRYMRHRLMQHVQGYTGSHWMPTSGDYSLRIASAAARATANKTTMYYVPTLMAISMVIRMRRYYTTHIAQWRRSRAFIKANKHRHQASTCSDSINRTLQRQLYLRFHREKGLELTCWPIKQSLTNNHLKYLLIGHQKTLKMIRLRVFWPPRLAPYHFTTFICSGCAYG